MTMNYRAIASRLVNEIGKEEEEVRDLRGIWRRVSGAILRHDSRRARLQRVLYRVNKKMGAYK